jgi:hypothetical protein
MDVRAFGTDDGPVTPARRVRHDVRDGVAVMAFSASASVAGGLVLTFLAGLGK